MPLPQMLSLALGLAALAYLASVAGILIAGAVVTGGRRDEMIAANDARSTSRFTIPVSIVVPVGRGTASLGNRLHRLLALNYPEFEVVVVCDAASPSLLEEMTRHFGLEARELFYRKTLPTSDVRRLYRSPDEPRLMVVDLESSRGFADAMNCGVNIARYRYVASIDPEVSFGADALLRLMAQPLADPGRIVGASQLVERIGGVGRLGSIRALMETRLLWRSRRHGLGGHDTVAVWRRDTVLKCGGFSLNAVDPAWTLIQAMQAAGEGGRFVRESGIFGTADAPPLTEQLRLAGRRQRSAWQSLARMLSDRGAMRWRTWIAFAHAEFLIPLAHVTLFGLALQAAVSGWTSWLPMVALIVLLAFGHAAVTAAALLLRGAAPDAPAEAELTQLLMAAPAEFFTVRPALALGRLLGTSRR